MNAAITGSVTRSEINGELTTSLGGIASLSLALLRSLDVTASASFSRQVIGTANVPAGVPINPIQNYSTYAAGLIWRASQQLYLQARISYFTFEGVSGLGQGFLIGWYPFPGGPLQLSASYAYDVDSISGQVSRRARIDANYYFSRHITLGAAYSSDFGNGGPSQQSIFLTLSLRL
jgi:hypothetical protein